MTMPIETPPARRAVPRAVALTLLLIVLTAVVLGLVLLAAPEATASGGCGGG